MVAEYGEKRAIELLKDCKAEIKPGLPQKSPETCLEIFHGRLFNLLINKCLFEHKNILY